MNGFYRSAKVDSNQSGIHPQLEKILLKRKKTNFKIQISDVAVSCFKEKIQSVPKELPLILDMGCGTGESTIAMAEKQEHFFYIGIDKSHARINKGIKILSEKKLKNCLLFPFHIPEFIYLSLQEGLRFEKIFILYPNPWPKKNHLKRRWHGHGVFPWFFKLTDKIEVRTNWEIYVSEWNYAVSYFYKLQGHIECISNMELGVSPLSPFEKKYLKSSHQIYLWVNN